MAKKFRLTIILSNQLDCIKLHFAVESNDAHEKIHYLQFRALKQPHAAAGITQFAPDTVSGIRYSGEDAHDYNEYMQILQLPDKAVLLSDIHAG